MMQMSQNGYAVLKAFEGLRLNAYPDPGTGGDPWTIGYGHTGKDVKPGLAWSVEQAESALRRDANIFEVGVNDLVDIVINQGQFDALVCFAYNAGLNSLKGSTLLRLVNEKKFDEALAQFSRWNKAAGRPMKGLTRRRAAESWLWRGLSGAEAIRKGQAAA